MVVHGASRVGIANFILREPRAPIMLASPDAWRLNVRIDQHRKELAGSVRNDSGSI